MSFEYLIEKNIKKTLSDGDKSFVISKVCNDWTKFNTARQTNIDKARELINAINFHKNNKVKKDENSWKANVRLGKIYMFYETLKAFIWKNIYSSINSMFDVSGENSEADNNSNKEKAMLVDIFEKMKFQKILDDIIDNALIYGELISFTGWKTIKEEIRRPVDFWANLFSGNLNEEMLKAQLAGRNYYTDSRTIYDNAFVYEVNPSYFVYDVAQRNNWNACPKIFKSFKTAQEIINNKIYKISEDDKRIIRDMCSRDNSANSYNQNEIDLRNLQENNTLIEVLEFWGDFELKDGTLLKNYHVVVVGGSILVRFSKNDLIINPFAYGNLFEDFETKRGISPLYSVVETAKVQETLINRTLDMQALTENPPVYAPKDFFKENVLTLEPGKIITYDQNLSQEKPQALKFASNIYVNDVSFLSDLMSEISGVYPNMMGADEDNRKTATEINVKVQGQTTRLAMILDTINQYLIIPTVENVAKLCANFKSGEEFLYVNKNNQPDIIKIDDNIRQGEYKFTYSDRSAIAEKVSRADDTVNAIKQFAQILPLNAQEVFTWYMEQKGVENPERFINQQPQNPAMQQMQGQIPQIPQAPEEVQPQEDVSGLLDISNRNI